MIWRGLQLFFWLAGLAILFCLLFFPSTGILLFWNILIPIAPLLFVVAAGLWRNICPLATTNLLPRHLGLSKGKKLSQKEAGILNLTAVIIFYLLVPLRHIIFNRNGPATAGLIIFMALTGICLGFFYEWKSVWCSGLCPVHPVEKLYGGNVLMPVPNAHCRECKNCVIPCPDSTPNMHPNMIRKNNYHQLSGILITGGLPGFIWGWFHVPDQIRITASASIFQVYQMPFMGFVLTLLIYICLIKILSPGREDRLTGIFAAAGVSCYYWYRIPALFGFGNFSDDGLLLNLGNTIPAWTVFFITIPATLFFIYWLVIRRKNNVSWVIRPDFTVYEKLIQ